MDVIIVDDEPAARRTLRECCAAEPDLRVIGEFGDGRAALEAIRARPPQLLFLDIQMDTMNGIEVAPPRPGDLPSIVSRHRLRPVRARGLRGQRHRLPAEAVRRVRACRTLEMRARAPCAQSQGPASASAADRQAALDAVLSQLERLARPATDRRPRPVGRGERRAAHARRGRYEPVESDRNYVRIRVGRDSFHARSSTSGRPSSPSQPMPRHLAPCPVNVEHVQRDQPHPSAATSSVLRRRRHRDQQRGLPRQGPRIPSIALVVASGRDARRRL